jgi:hypothetical protein
MEWNTTALTTTRMTNPINKKSHLGRDLGNFYLSPETIQTALKNTITKDSENLMIRQTEKRKQGEAHWVVASSCSQQCVIYYYC